MNDETVLLLGEYAYSTLQSPQFELLTKLFEQQVAVDILGTAPDASAERERLYATLQGGRAFRVFLADFALKYEERAQVQTEPHVQDDDNPDVHDIYRKTID